MTEMLSDVKKVKTPAEFPKKLLEKYSKLEEITYDFLTPVERDFLKAQVEEARQRKQQVKRA